MFKNHGAKVSNFFQAGNTAFTEHLQVINSCFDNASPHGKQGGGGEGRADTKTASVDEIKSFLDGHVSLRFNEITSRVEYCSSESNRNSIGKDGAINEVPTKFR